MRHRHTIINRLVLALGLGVALIAPSSSAWAESGAEVTHAPPSCVTVSTGTICSDFQYVTVTAETPSGNQVFVLNGHEDRTFTGAAGGPAEGCVNPASADIEVHLLVKDGEVQVQGQHADTTVEQISCGGQDFVCTSTFDAQYVNGKIVFSVFDEGCTP